MNAMARQQLDSRKTCLQEGGVAGHVWQISGMEDGPHRVTAEDWMAALGIMLRQQGRMAALGGLACEQVTQQHVIINDFVHSVRYVVELQEAPAVLSLCEEEVIPLSEATGMGLSTDEEMSVEAFEIEDRVTGPTSFAKLPVQTCDVVFYENSSMFIDPCEEETLIMEDSLIIESAPSI